MASQQSCAYYSGQAFIELENIQRLADKDNAESVDNHLTLLEKEFDKVGMFCGIGDLSVEKKYLGDIRTSLTNKQLAKVSSDARQIEKELILKLAKFTNEGGDPLEIIPSRMLDSLK